MHTPLPWKLWETEKFHAPHYEGLNIETLSNDTVICEMAGGLPLHEILANANLIVRACDSHAEMLNLLKAVNDRFNDHYDITDDDEGGDFLQDEIRLAIAKAEGRE